MNEAVRIFPSPCEFNSMADISKTNCLAFAFGQTKSSKDRWFSEYILDYQDPDGWQFRIEKSFENKVSRHFNMKVKEVRQLPNEPDGSIYFILYGWFRYGDFHVVRVERDGTWVHKPDGELPACIIEPGSEFFNEYSLENDPCHFFVLVED